MRQRGTRALVLSGGTVVDGTRAPRFVADVRIEGDRIAAIGTSLPKRDAEVQDVTQYAELWLRDLCTAADKH